jgi:hypothetical protein
LVANEDNLVQVLERKGPPTTHPDLRALIDEFRPDKTFAAISTARYFAAWWDAVLPSSITLEEAFLANVRAVVVDADVGDDARVNIALLCSNVRAASELKSEFDRRLAIFRSDGPAENLVPFKGALGSLSIASSDSMIRVAATLSPTEVLSLVSSLSGPAKAGGTNR